MLVVSAPKLFSALFSCKGQKQELGEQESRSGKLNLVLAEPAWPNTTMRKESTRRTRVKTTVAT